MKAKSKGCKAERELVEILWQRGYSAIRVAGSGVSKFPCPDILASNGSKVFAIECKSTKGETQYVRKQQIQELVDFAQLFGAKPICAVRFNNYGWRFIEPHKMKESGKFHVTNKKHMEEEGCLID